jgi:hypothetical protein
LSARLVLSSSASLAFSSAWLCQDCAPLRVARSCWSWAQAEANSLSDSAVATCTANAYSRAFRGDCGDVFRSLGVPLLELVPHSA